MMIPLQVLIVPLFVELKTLGLLDTYLGVLLPTFASAFGIFLLRQAINTVPRELDEAATHRRRRALPDLLDASSCRTSGRRWRRSRSSRSWAAGTASCGRSSCCARPSSRPSPIALAGLQGQYTTEWDIVMAGSVVSVLPMLALYVFAQKYVIQGVASSGIK